MNHQEKYACLQLALTPYIGAETFLRLWQHFGSAEAALNAGLSAVKPFFKRADAAAAWQSAEAKQAADLALAWEEKHHNARLLLICDEDYPAILSEGMTPPPLLFARGQLSCLNHAAIAVVGSRHATPQAMRIARDFGSALSARGICVVSGMADGIDAAAHEGALTEQGSTIAVWGTGIDRVYPARNKQLAERIAEKGLILSEFPLGTRPIAGNFPRRNRIIAGLSQAVLVAEAALASGSLITARLAAEMGREVMAIPGSIDNPHSKGCHALIKQGAKLVENLDDILEECPALLRLPENIQAATVNHNKAKAEPAEKSEEKSAIESEAEPAQTSPLLKQMGYDPIHPDELAQQLDISAADVHAELTLLALDGKIAAVGGGRYQRVK
ncbi:DNA-processing protein DprA [Stenoxybacter acetivorans]|uniref:DNA-processing protein DprA n=1 Tax=Stenoxybacter acetivorans TaxID=422441 RepID=UPI0005655B74|nr:DNA-processing protein DprA [Stenoxybacter acetivorans]